MSDFVSQYDRPIDICFAGGYSNLHIRRNRLLELLASLANQHHVVLALTHPQRKPLIDLPLLRRVPGPFAYLPENLRRVAVPPVFGLEMYQLFGQAKIVFNGYGEIAEQYRGNMRCFEAMGCGACMLSEAGIYPEHMTAGIHFETFRDEAELRSKITGILVDPSRAERMGCLASENLQMHYSKAAQWKAFQDLVASI
ncbi:MAG: glycosyltransferase [Verrucomicrobia bacterium]|nr:glycosyltransferase [Verrucomicrobiota bacterium]